MHRPTEDMTTPVSPVAISKRIKWAEKILLLLEHWTERQFYPVHQLTDSFCANIAHRNGGMLSIRRQLCLRQWRKRFFVTPVSIHFELDTSASMCRSRFVFSSIMRGILVVAASYSRWLHSLGELRNLNSEFSSFVSTRHSHKISILIILSPSWIVCRKTAVAWTALSM